MKYFSSLILLFVTLVTISSCKQSEVTEKSSAKTIVSGKIINRDVYPEYMTVTVNVQDFRGADIIYVDSIKADGTFRVEFDLFIIQDIAFHPIVGSFLAKPGDSIYIDIDFENIGYVDFSGDFAKANQDYHKYVNSNYALDYYIKGRNTADALSFLMFCDSVRDLMYSKKAEYINKVSPEKEVIEWARKSVDIQYSIVLMEYLLRTLHRYQTENKSWEVPNEYVLMINEIENLFNDTIITSNTYQLVNLLAVKNYLNHTVDSISSHKDFLENQLKIVTEKYTHDLLRQLMIGTYFYQEFSRNSVDLFENNSQFLHAHITLPFIMEPLFMNYAFVKNHIENPQIRHNEILERLGDTPGRTLIDSVLNAHKGKVLYIDFWATWCRPCIEALPKANIMIQQYEDENIEFVFLCLGVDKSFWEKTLNSIDMQGSHFFSENREETNSLMIGLQIRGLPFYALVNTQGYITETGYYLSPMSPVTLDKINNLLEK